MVSVHHVLVFIVFLTGLASASSVPPRPLKRLAHPSTLSIEILPRQQPHIPTYGKRSYPPEEPVLRHTDTFRLKLSAFDDIFHLHLRPNEHLIHPAARIKYYSTTPTGQTILTHTEPLPQDSVKAYWGEVIPAELSSERLREDAAGALTGPTRNSQLGWARIVVHHQGDVASGLAPVFEGAFSVNGVTHHVMTKENYLRNKHHLDPHITLSEDHPDSALVIWRDADVMSPQEEVALSDGIGPGYAPIQPKTCGHDQLSYNTDPALNPALRGGPPVTPWYSDPLGFLSLHGVNLSSGKRDDVAGGGMGSNFQNNIGQSAGCPTDQKLIYMGVAADCEYTRHYGAQANATTQILTNWNTASALYKSTFNISLGIIELQIQDSSCPSTPDPAFQWNLPCTANATLNDRLSLFSDWRGHKEPDAAGLWHLMSGCPTGTEVGIAWLATLCQQDATGTDPNVVSGTAVTTAGRVEWQVVSHEIGHNFGAIHDCTDGCESNSTQCCPFTSGSCDANSQFIMNPVADSGEMKFSPCSLGNICSLMLGTSGAKTNQTCLIDPADAQNLVSLQMCGNGIVEEGEECDPGPGTNSTCCNPTTCKFTSGAVCDPLSSPCCTQQCGFAPSGQVCRPAQDPQCDTAEVCTGSGSACPADVVSPDGQKCGSGLACASGQCTSLDQQCQVVGASMNLQKTCPGPDQKSCKVTCQDPTQSDSCIQLQSSLIDGSPCGYGGKCYDGDCKAGSLLDTIEAWYKQNLQIAIPVTVAIGLAILLILYGLYRCCTRSRRPPPRQNNSQEPIMAKTRARRISSWTGQGVPELADVGAQPQPTMTQAKDAPAVAPRVNSA